MKYSLALVEYLNTLPFSEGLRLEKLDSKLIVHPVTPAQCAAYFENGKADISLCPVGALPDMPRHDIRSRYCIGADGEVGTVQLLSKVPLDEITAVRLDPHSRTSNILIRILAQELWKKDWVFHYVQSVHLAETCLMIGDKVFDHKSHFEYRYDLGLAWKTLTGLPMVFAVWIAKPGIPDEIIAEMDNAFEAGLRFIQSGPAHIEKWKIDYLLNHISYPLDPPKLDALELFSSWASQIEALPTTS